MQKIKLKEKMYLKKICSLLCVFMLIIQPNMVFAINKAPDLISPNLLDIKLNNTTSPTITLKSQDEILITVHTDEKNPFLGGSIRFVHPSSEKSIGSELLGSYFDSELQKEIQFPTGVAGTVLKINEFQYPGIYELEHLYIFDGSSNANSYHKNPTQEDLEFGIKKLDINLELIVETKHFDLSPPVLEDIKINGNNVDFFEVKLPGSLYIEIETSDDISGLEWGRVVFTNIVTGHSIGINWNPDQVNDNTLCLEWRLNQFQYPGKYYLSQIILSDKANNHVTYSNKYNNYNNQEDLPLERDLVIELIKPDKSFPYSFNINNPNLAKEISNLPSAPNGESPTKIWLESNEFEVVSKDVFEAISGKNKQIIIENDNIQWIFDGSNIDLSKIQDIDLKSDISRLDNMYGGNSDKIKNIIGDTPSYLLSFNNNTLPGPVTIRLRVGYLFAQYMGRNDLNIYSYNQSKNELLLVQDNIRVYGDGYIEFVIDHNRDFVITKGNPFA